MQLDAEPGQSCEQIWIAKSHDDSPELLRRSKEDGQFAQGAIHVAGADGQHGVARAASPTVLDALLQAAAIDHVLVPGRADRVGQRLGGDAANGRLARRVDIGRSPARRLD